ncbi:hypothetical protein [Caballeronia sp. J97]|uniref:hypothetical protein n=1 Tax=Caballeronia sp. J97 TaxID=2805429 RepID=UPI002AAFBAC3|nr:hypothetical protein [Caballeronia sp. J97]
MNRPDYSLSLDSVICKRCNTISPASEDTCPSCGADRQGAIFTSRAEPAPAVAASVPAPLDILDWDDSHWLQRLVRRRMLTSYPNFIEPGDSQEQRKPARTGIAMLVGGVVASIAVGAYFYARLDDNAPPPSAEPGISVAGSVRDNASAASKADASRHASLMRSKADSPNAQAVTPAAPVIAKASPAHEERTVVAPSVPVAAHAATQAPSTAPRVEPRVAATSTPASASTVAAVAPAKPPMPVAHVTATPPSLSNATSATVATTKPSTPSTTTSAAASALAPSVKPAAPVIASVQKPEPRVSTTLAAASPAPAKPVTQASMSTPTPTPTSTPVARPSEPPRSSTAVASAPKPAAPSAPPVAEPLPAAVARSIAAVQQALASRDLASARRNMRGLYASEPRSPEIQQLAAELSRQERARDGAMANARACAANMDAACALRNARRAVTLDPRNGQTQATLRRALAVQNEANTEYFRQASGIPKPIVPTMSFDGRWTAGTRHGAMSGDQDDSSFTLFGAGVPVVSKGRGDAH